jgi:hypothetical protein
MTLPSIAGKTLGTNNNHFTGLVITLPASKVYTLDLAQVQLEEGSQATTFEQRFVGDELRLCQRYYETSGGSTYLFSSGGITSGQGYYSPFVSFKVNKRVNPSITLTNIAANAFPSSPGSIWGGSVSMIGFLEYRVANGNGTGYFGCT